MREPLKFIVRALREVFWIAIAAAVVFGGFAILPASTVHVDGEMTYARIDTVPDGARLILTDLTSPVEGMDLRDVAALSDATVTE
jgi:hypothetical protein